MDIDSCIIILVYYNIFRKMAANIDPVTGQPVIDIVLPTFRMEPEENERFYPSQARATAENIMKEVLDGVTYDEEESKFLGPEISDKVREAVQGGLGIPRFKIVVQTTIGQLADQGIRIASRCLWDVSTDNYASASYKNVCCGQRFGSLHAHCSHVVCCLLCVFLL
jgi:tctex1 domain-containing protein 2